MAGRCSHVYDTGEQCRARALQGGDLCRSHNPETNAKIQEASRKAIAESPRRCKAQLKSTGQQCRQVAVAGMEVCTWHGGRTRQAKAGAAVRIAEEKARKELERLGQPVPVRNALEALRTVAGEVVAFKDACARVLDQLADSGWRYASQQDLEQVRGEVIVFERALDRSVTTLAALARVQVDERLAGIREATLVMLAAALRDALASSGIDSDTAQVVKADFAKRIRVIEAA